MSIKESQIVQALSLINLPEPIVRDGDIQGLIKGMMSDQITVKTTTQRLERLRREEKGGNSGNSGNSGRNDRSDHTGEAQSDLNKSIGNLTQRSSQLLIINTAISKVLGDQQNRLRQQTDDLAAQSSKMLNQQIHLEIQQDAIIQANAGLMEARGVTQEQAIQLVGCVERVSEAEAKIGEANQRLRELIEKRFSQNMAQCTDQIHIGLKSQEQRNTSFQQRLANALAQQNKQTQGELERLAQANTELQSEISERLQSLSASTAENFKTQQAAVTQQGMAMDASARELREVLDVSMADSAEQLRDLLEASMADSAEQLREILQASIADSQQELLSAIVTSEQRQATVGEQQALHSNTQWDNTQTSLTQLTLELDNTIQVVRRQGERLQRLAEEQARNFRRQRTGLFVVAGGVIASLAWQAASHFV